MPEPHLVEIVWVRLFQLVPQKKKKKKKKKNQNWMSWLNLIC